MSKYHDDTTRASDRVQLDISGEMLRRLEPDLFRWKSLFFRFNWNGVQLRSGKAIELIAEHMTFGDSRAALVMQESPLVVAAYTDELDCVALLGFPQWLATELQWRKGSRLLTVNTYARGKHIHPDLRPGPANVGRWVGFMPIIAESISGSTAIIEQRKTNITNAEWERTWACGKAALAAKQAIRSGRPLHSWKPAIGSRAI